LAVAHSILGRSEDAKSAARRALALNPDDTIERVMASVPIVDKEARSLYLAELR
jgi:hypothetical protein